MLVETELKLAYRRLVFQLFLRVGLNFTHLKICRYSCSNWIDRITMTLQLIDELTETRGNANRECIAQGAANITNDSLEEWVVVR